jgi:hypothetical protein
MKRQFGVAIFAMAAVLGVWSQEPAPAAPVQEPGPKPAYTQVDPGKSLDFLGEAVSESTLTLGVNIMAAYDTNIAAFSRRRQPMASYLFSPSIGVQQYRAKWSMNLNYNGGLGIYDQLPNSNSYSQSGSADILYQVAPHWQVHAKDLYSYSANPFGSYYTIIGQPTPNYPNPITYVPFAATNQNLAQLDVANQLSRYDTLTFTGTESFRRYTNYSNTYNFQIGLQNLISYMGGANFSHRFSPRISGGVGYNFQSMDFSHGQQRSGTSTIQFFANYQLSPSWSLSGWIGPQYISSKTTICIGFRCGTLLQDSWSAAGGMNVGWQGLRDSFTTGFSKQISDGGGLLATTVMYSVNGAYRRKLSARWDGVASMQWGNNNSFAASNLNKQLFPDRNFTLLQTYLTLNREITRRITGSLQYGYTHQNQTNIYLTGTPSYNDSRFSASVQYNWNHPLGR